jgi:hypothetical protein
VFARYWRTHFLKDAQRLGLSDEAAFSRAELRRRRDQLMAVHHPDHGGDASMAAEVNETYKRMIEWLDKRQARSGGAPSAAPVERMQDAAKRPRKKSKLVAGAARIASAAIVVAGVIAAMRSRRR